MILRDPSTPRGGILAWSLFDFANTAFYVVVLTVGYPTYFRRIVAGASDQADFLWGLSFSVSMAVVALISPVLGAVSDSGLGKKRFLAFFTALCIVATALLYFVESPMIAMGMVLLILANVGFEAGLVFYDAFLPEITTEEHYGRVSGYGFAMGYVGSLVTLGIVFSLYVGGFEAQNLPNIRLSFLVAALLFAVFALPLFLVLRERRSESRLSAGVIRKGFARVGSTIREISHFSNIARFLLAYFLYIDAVNTIIIFSGIFALETLKMTLSEIVVFFAMVQTSAIAGSAAFGWVADRIGQKRTLNLTLSLWMVIIVTAFMVEDVTMFYVVGIFAGIALGSSQSVSRSLMSHLTPAEKKTEFFGFYSFFGKAAAILGPLIFGYVASRINQRSAILSVGILLFGGLVLLQRVKDPSMALPRRSGLAKTDDPASS
jgi:MFS transporter, UMF1 family